MGTRYAIAGTVGAIRRYPLAAVVVIIENKVLASALGRCIYCVGGIAASLPLSHTRRFGKTRVFVKKSLLNRACFALLLLVNTNAEAEPLRVYDWPFGKSVFCANLPSFERITGYPVEHPTVDFPFSENVEQNFIQSEPMDIVAMFPPAVRRLADAGWIESLSDDQNFVEAEKHSYKKVNKARRIDGELFGVGQIATGFVVPLVDMDENADLGFGREDFRQDCCSLNHQLVSAVRPGHAGIYLPFCFDDINGLPLGFMADVLNMRHGQFIGAYYLVSTPSAHINRQCCCRQSTCELTARTPAHCLEWCKTGGEPV